MNERNITLNEGENYHDRKIAAFSATLKLAEQKEAEEKDKDGLETEKQKCLQMLMRFLLNRELEYKQARDEFTAENRRRITVTKGNTD